MSKELLMLMAMSISGTLFALGGTEISPKIKGQKWLRRYLLPVLLGIVAYIGGKSLQNSLYFATSLSVSLHLPYGERTPYWIKTIVFISIFSSSLWLGFTLWQIISPILVIILFKISNAKWGQNIIFWKAWEFITGSLVGITVANLLAR